MNFDHIREECINERNKIIQELKRQMLNIKMEQYENKIQKDDIDMLMMLLNKYLNHHRKRWMRQIRF